MGEEKLRNGGFETRFPATFEEAAAVKVYRAFGWWYLLPSMVDRSVRRSGECSIRLSRTDKTFRFNSYGQVTEIALPPGAAYRLSFWYRTDAAKALRFSASCVWKTAKMRPSKQEPARLVVRGVPQDGGWSYCEQTVVSPPASESSFCRCYVAFHLERIDPDRSLWIDDVSLRQLLFGLDGLTWSDGRAAARLSLARTHFGSDESIAMGFAIESDRKLTALAGKATMIDSSGNVCKSESTPAFDTQPDAITGKPITLSTEGLANGAYRIVLKLADASEDTSVECIAHIEVDNTLDPEVTRTLAKLREASAALRMAATQADTRSFPAAVRRQRAKWHLQEAQAAYGHGAWRTAQQQAEATLAALE